ncbi:MAG: fatty acyl-AMP ligase [Actinobacteria bacterium]|nr:MAG: fatty acyl-AMP ligase [Actinomycetota bacterium]
MGELSGRIERATARGGAITFLHDDSAERVTWSQLHEEATATAAGLQARGVGPGSHVALLGPTTRSLVTTIEATWLAGCTLVVLPLPMRLGSIEEFVDQTRRRVAGADAALVVLDPELAPFLEPEAGDPPTVLFSDLAGTAAAFERPVVDESALAVLQFTSGATADPKGVMLPHHTVLANLDAAAAAAGLHAGDDVLVSWLPLYHDMGLMKLTLAMITGTDFVLAPPQDFLASPGRWMEWMSAFGGTASAGPNFSYALATRALKHAGGLDLSRWRVCLNGAEPIHPSTVEAFCEAATPHGFDARAVFCAFGMAELTIAGTFPVPMTGMQVDPVDRRVLEIERYAAPGDPSVDTTRRLARLGRPVPGLEMRVVDAGSGSLLSEREVGELQFRGPSVTSGYYRRPDATADAFDGDWLRTGDLAYVVEGELVLCGRMKDVIIVGGRNVFPEDVERAAETVDGVRAGNVIAFGVERGKGREGLVVVAETKSDDAGPLRQAVTRRVRQAIGLPPEDVVFVSPGTLPKTSSGKLQRSLCRSRYLNAQLQPV